MDIIAARYFPRTNDPQQMVIHAAKEFFSDTGRYPTHAAISRLYWPAWGSSQLVLCDPVREPRTLGAPETVDPADPPRMERSVIQIAYRDDVQYGWVKCVYQPIHRVIRSG